MLAYFEIDMEFMVQAILNIKKYAFNEGKTLIKV
jgi:hypothetical protein